MLFPQEESLICDVSYQVPCISSFYRGPGDLSLEESDERAFRLANHRAMSGLQLLQTSSICITHA